MKLPKPIRAVSEQFEKLPGIGPKSAQRHAFYLLRVPEYVLDEFAQSLRDLKRMTKFCEFCHNIGEETPCVICADPERDQSVICVVESPLDVLALEQSGKFTGRYHVLHGVISPLDNIGPDELYLRDILKRLEGVREIILATNPTMEGEGTALFIEKMVRDAGYDADEIRVTRIGHGLPVGADIEFADSVTLSRALEGRRTL